MIGKNLNGCGCPKNATTIMNPKTGSIYTPRELLNAGADGSYCNCNSNASRDCKPKNINGKKTCLCREKFDGVEDVDDVEDF